MKILAVIPARYNSSRFPGKPLADINGKTMVQRVYEQVKQAGSLAEVVVATDDDRIAQTVKEFGGKFVMTSPDHPSGTDRCAEVLDTLADDFDAVINIQGDEPFIHPEQIEQLAAILKKHNTEIASLVRKAHHTSDLFDSSKVKAVFDSDKKALFFSRSPIPYNRQAEQKDWLQSADYYLHVGIYGYTADVLREITRLPMSHLEKAESLEQLRWLQNGYTIHLDITPYENFGVDTPADLERLLKEMAGR